MFGKVLKISSNDLYGNVDDRVVRVYACFQHIKYNNNYVIFSFEGDTKKLYFGSVHMKKKSLVIFSIKDDLKKYILEFIDQYLNSKLKNFKLLKLDEIEKVELVSHNEMEFDNLLKLDEISIPKKVVNDENESKGNKNTFLYVIVFLLVLLAIGLTVVYFNPQWFTVKYNVLECNGNLYDEKLELYYDIEKKVVFDTDNKLESIDVIRTYTFLDSNSYYEFKNNDNHNEYFNFEGEYKYILEELKLKIFYKESSIIDDYDEMLIYLKRKGFNCVEKKYEK